MARKSAHGYGLLWEEYLRDPLQWLDNKLGSAHPDKATKLSLWIDNSCWAGRQAQAQEEGANEKNESTTFFSLLRACAKNKDLCRGSVVHDDILRRGLLNTYSDALVSMYIKCDALAKARKLFDMYKSKDAFTWTALISKYAQKGQAQDALNFYEQMQQEGLSPNAVTFTCVLKACARLGAADKGEKIHDVIAKQGLLGNDMVLGTALVDMYAKCGALAKARQVLEELPVRDVISWNALITGYVEHGEGSQALICFEQLQQEHLSPDAVTFACVLKACGSIRAADKGESIHDEITKQGLLENNVVLGTALVGMYAKCGALAKARRVLEGLHVQDVISWTALIAGYTEHGKAVEALSCFEEMQGVGLSPNAVTFTCILKACGSIREVGKGEKIHDEIAKLGLPGNDVMLGTALVDMYAKCGALAKARRVLEELPVQDVISWNALISGYAEHGQAEQALNCFEQLQREGLSPNVMTFTCALKACGRSGAIDKGEKIHDEICKQGLLENDIVLGSALVDMYAKCGALAKARRVLKELNVRDVVSWTAVIAGYAEHGEGMQALDCFEQMQCEGLFPDAVTLICALKACGSIRAASKGGEIHDEIAKHGLLESDIALGNALVDMYAKCGALAKARQVHEELPARDVTSWTTLISGYAEHGEGARALNCFEQMQHEGLSPDAVTFACILKACGSLGATSKGEKIHDEIAKQGLLGKNIVLGTALVDMYAKCGALTKAQQVLEDLYNRDVKSWTALIAGYADHGEGMQAINCFEQMQLEGISPDVATFACVLKACGSIGAADKGERIHDEIAKQGLFGNNNVLGTALVDMYAKCNALAKARQVLEELHVRDVTSWNALMTGYTEHGEGVQVLNCFELMQREGLAPDAVTFVCVLKACGSMGAAGKGEKIHDEIAQQGLLGSNIVIGTALVDMYAKCGALPKARRVLEELPVRDVISWTVLIGGLIQQGKGAQALNCFEEMQQEGLSPDAATFSCILNACSRLGLVEDAQNYFVNMSAKYGMKPDLGHYACMVDVFGRAGYLDKAVGVIKKMPFSDSSVWSALLGACRKWGDVKVGKWAFEQAIQADKSDGAFYVLMAHIYTAAGMQEDAENVEAMRRKNEAWKQ